jgi:hypothetical protein
MFKALIRKLLLIEFFAAFIAGILIFINLPYSTPHETTVTLPLVVINFSIPVLLVLVSLIGAKSNLERFSLIHISIGGTLFYYCLILLVIKGWNYIFFPQLLIFIPFPLYIPPVFAFLQGALYIITGLILLPHGSKPIVSIFKMKHWGLLIITNFIYFIALSYNFIGQIFSELTNELKLNDPVIEFPVWFYVTGTICNLLFIRSLMGLKK